MYTYATLCTLAYTNFLIIIPYMDQTNLFICMSIRKTELIRTRFCINKSMWSFIDIMLYLLPIRIEKLNRDFFSLNYLILEFKTQSLLSSGSQIRCTLGQFWKTRRTISVTGLVRPHLLLWKIVRRVVWNSLWDYPWDNLLWTMYSPQHECSSQMYMDIIQRSNQFFSLIYPKLAQNCLVAGIQIYCQSKILLKTSFLAKTKWLFVKILVVN